MTWRPPANVSQKEIDRLVIIESDKFERELKSKIEQGMNDEDLTFYEFAQRFLVKTKAEHSASYYEKCKDAIEYSKNEIGKIKLKALTPAIIQNFYNKIDTRKRHITTITPVPEFKDILRSKGFSHRYLRYKLDIQEATLDYAYKGRNVSLEWANILVERTGIPFDTLFIRNDKYVDYAFETNHAIKRVCRTIGAYAKKQRLIQDNYFSSDYIDFPNRPKKQIHTLTDEDAVKFYKYLQESNELKISTPIMLALIVGMRRGEIGGLQWSDIDFDKKRLTIKRTLTTVKRHGVILKEPKTNTSYRTITLSDDIINQLKRYREWQLSEMERLGDFYQDNDWVFTQVDGKRCNPSYFTHEMTRLCAEAGVPHYNVHSLRHTAAATMLMSGVSISVVAQRLGHARPSTSTDIYGYVLQTAEASAANATSEYLNSIASKPMVTEAVNELDEATKFREAKAEMQRLGFSDYNEYLDYLEFKRLKEIRKAPR